MFTNLWKKCVQWQASRRRPAPRPKRTILRFEVLEDRLTPTNFNASINGVTGIMTLSKAGTGNGTLTFVNNPGTFGGYIINATNGTTITYLGTVYTTFINTVPVNKIALNLAGSNDTITFDGTGANGAITLSAGLSITATGGNKSITAKSVNLGTNSTNTKVDALYMSFGRGAGTETSLFTDVNVTGPAVITHTSTGDTSFTINTSATNPIATNNWNSLSITNGTGSDINTIKDTDFVGNVVIANGKGAGNVNQYGGSHTVFSDGLSKGLLTANNITVSTTTGQSDTEVYDYNIRGTVNINTGAGVANMSVANFAGVENNATTAGVGVPTVGNVIITATAVSTLSPGANVYLGQNLAGAADYPLFIPGKLTITGEGAGSVHTLLNNLTVTGATAINFGVGRSTTSNDLLTIQGDKTITSYGPITVTAYATGTNSYNVQTIQGNTNVIGALTFKLLGNATDTVTLGLGNTGFVNTSGALAVTGYNGSKTLNVRNSQLGGVSTSIARGSGVQNFTFTDTNVLGAATMTHTSVGNTFLTITDSALNVPMFNSWNSLTITDGTGSDTNLIYDTSFAGTVTIKNGAGTGTTQYGGSRTLFAANLNQALLSIHGNLYVSTTTGQSDTEVYDYNVHGTVTILTGNGIAGQSTASVVGLENHQTLAGSGVPVIGGAVAITATTVGALVPGVTVLMGTSGVANQNYPLFLNGALTISAAGSGSASITLNDLEVAGATTITLPATTTNDTVTVQGSAITSIYSSTFTLNAYGSGNNTYNFQDNKGSLQMYGAVKINFGSGNDTLNLAADNTSPNGVNNAVLDFFYTSYINGGAGLNFLYANPYPNIGATFFYFYTPVQLNI